MKIKGFTLTGQLSQELNRLSKSKQSSITQAFCAINKNERNLAKTLVKALEHEKGALTVFFDASTRFSFLSGKYQFKCVGQEDLDQNQEFQNFKSALAGMNTAIISTKFVELSTSPYGSTQPHAVFQLTIDTAHPQPG